MFVSKKRGTMQKVAFEVWGRKPVCLKSLERVEKDHATPFPKLQNILKTFSYREMKQA